MKRLTDKNKKFIEFYLQSNNASQAFADAGYKCAPETRAVAAYNLLQKPQIKEEIKRRTERALRQFDITTDNVLQELAYIAFFDPRKLYNADGTMRDITALDEATAKCISQIKETYKAKGDRVLEVKPWDKISALEHLGKYLGVLTSGGSVNITQANAEKGGVILIPQIENMEQWQQVVVAGESFKKEKRKEFERLLEVSQDKEAEVISNDNEEE